MPYTLSMALLWVALAVLLGIVIGWLMRSVVAKRQVERARSNHLDNVELERLRARVAELEPTVAERDSLRAQLDECREAARAPDATASPPTATAGADLDAAATVLGRDVALDDLTVIDGIGPTIAELCAGIGITTWRELAGTEVSLLRTMLHDAGPRFRTQDPSTWPQQAGLLAAGRWDEFAALSREIAGGTG